MTAAEIKDKYIKTRIVAGAYFVSLKIENQSFLVVSPQSKASAKKCAEMLAIALERMVNEATK